MLNYDTLASLKKKCFRLVITCKKKSFCRQFVDILMAKAYRNSFSYMCVSETENSRLVLGQRINVKENT